MRVVVLSDLHLGTTAGTATEEAFVSFLQGLTERADSDPAPTRLVLLGDLLDLLHPLHGARDQLSALDAVAARHRAAFAALGAAAAEGIVVDLVPGNHDSELLDPEMQERMRALLAAAAGTSAALLRTTFRVRPWFLLLPGLLYAEHGSQYHALNAVANPLVPCGRWSRRLPLGAVLDLSLSGAGRGAPVSALPRLVPAVLGALARRGRTDAAIGPSLQACAKEAGLSPGALVALRGLAEDTAAALLRSAWGAMFRSSGRVESRQQRAAIAVHGILARERQSVPVYVFGHTHRVAHRALLGEDGVQLLWFNGGAWSDDGYCFVEVERREGSVAVRVCRWDPIARSTHTLTGPLSVSSGGAQERAPATRGRGTGNRSAEPVATP